MTIVARSQDTEDFTVPFDGDVVADVFAPKECANCGAPVPSFLRYCSTRCWRREDEGR